MLVRLRVRRELTRQGVTLARRAVMFCCAAVSVVAAACSIPVAATAPAGAGALYVVTVGLFGVADAGNNTLLYAVVGTRFEQRTEGAIAAAKMTEALFLGSMFFLGARVPVGAQLAALGTTVVLGAAAMEVFNARGGYASTRAFGAARHTLAVPNAAV